MADFISPRGDDYIGLFAVTSGYGLETLVNKYDKDLDDYSSIMVKVIADRLAEAATEWLHEKIRKEDWGYSASENFNNDSPAMSSILVDVTNFANRSVLLRIDDLPEEVDVNASIFLSDLEDSEGPIVGNVSLLTNKQLGYLFASIVDEESETNLELSIPEVPERVDLDIELGDDIYANFSSSSAPSRIILGIESGNTTEMETTWTHGILLRQDDRGDVLRMYLEGTLT